MNRRLSIAIAAIAMLASALYAEAKSIVWTVAPRYDNIVRYSATLFDVVNGGKGGLVGVDGQEILPCEFDFIPPFVNGYTYAVVKEGARLRIKYIVDDGGGCVAVNDRLYLAEKSNKDSRYFSEGLMVVQDINGKYGYVNVYGQLAIKCKYDYARPFKEGVAPMKTGNYYRYRTTGESVAFAVELNNGDPTECSCFKNGLALIGIYGKYQVIDRIGRKVRSIKSDEFARQFAAYNAAPAGSAMQADGSLAGFQQLGKYGLTDGGSVVAMPQFDSFSASFGDGYAVVAKNGRYGVVRVVHGDYSLTVVPLGGGASGSLTVDRDGAVEPLVVRLNMPDGITAQSVSVYGDLGDGHVAAISPLSSTQTDGGNQFCFTPKTAPGADSCTVQIHAENGGLLVASTILTYGLDYPVLLRASAPRTATERADENDNQVVYATIYNDGNRQVTVEEITIKARTSATLRSKVIPAHGSIVIQLTESKVKTEQTLTATVSLSNGVDSSGKITLKPYY